MAIRLMDDQSYCVIHNQTYNAALGLCLRCHPPKPNGRAAK